MPFKEHHQCISPHRYNDVRAHIQEMLDTGAIWKSHSPWDSTVVLVWKKDGSLRFCIDLRKLNNWTIKDAYLLPPIDETLDSLQGSQWLSSLTWSWGTGKLRWMRRANHWLHLPLGHWASMSVKGWLLDTTNAPTTLQRLTETCLGDLNLHWCIIHLENIVIFSKDPAMHCEKLEAMFQKLEEAELNSSLLSVSYYDGRLPTCGMWSLPKE